jgi:hypothetical protein
VNEIELSKTLEIAGNWDFDRNPPESLFDEYVIPSSSKYYVCQRCGKSFQSENGRFLSPSKNCLCEDCRNRVEGYACERAANIEKDMKRFYAKFVLGILFAFSIIFILSFVTFKASGFSVDNIQYDFFYLVFLFGGVYWIWKYYKNRVNFSVPVSRALSQLNRVSKKCEGSVNFYHSFKNSEYIFLSKLFPEINPYVFNSIHEKTKAWKEAKKTILGDFPKHRTLLKNFFVFCESFRRDDFDNVLSTNSSGEKPSIFPYIGTALFTLLSIGISFLSDPSFSLFDFWGKIILIFSALLSSWFLIGMFYNNLCSSISDFILLKTLLLNEAYVDSVKPAKV